jgi:carbon starvation protein
MGIHVKELPALSRSSGEIVAARTGGGVSLAVGMARVFSGLPGMSTLLAYWYHFAIMFEALFILTTIDTGTRVGRFLVQEFLGKMSPALGKTESVPAGVVATLLVVGGWTAFLLTGTVQTIWPMFGIANQLLAVVALAVGTTFILKSERRRYAWVTFVPLCFVGTTTITAGVMAVANIYVPLTHAAEHAKRVQGWSSALFTSGLLVCVVVILAWSFATWVGVLRRQSQPIDSGPVG